MTKYASVNPHAQLTPEQSEFARKIAAAREASKLSTGPRTEEGKAIASKNAVKHGFAGSVMVIDDEDKEAYEMHLDAYHRSFRPIGQPECDAVRLIANAMWRIDRLTSIETGLFELEASFHAPHIDALMQNLSLHHYYAIAFKEQIGDSNPFELCRRYLSSAQRDFHRAIVTFNLLKENRVTAQEQPPSENRQAIHIVPNIVPRPSKPQSNQQEPNELAFSGNLQPQSTAKIGKFSRKARKQRRNRGH
jgi:hypothetical protein